MSRCRYEVAPIDGLCIVLQRDPTGPWRLSVDGKLKFGPEFLKESHIADAKAEALVRVDAVLLDLRIAIGDVAR